MVPWWECRFEPQSPSVMRKAFLLTALNLGCMSRAVAQPYPAPMIYQPPASVTAPSAQQLAIVIRDLKLRHARHLVTIDGLRLQFAALHGEEFAAARPVGSAPYPATLPGQQAEIRALAQAIRNDAILIAQLQTRIALDSR